MAWPAGHTTHLLSCCSIRTASPTTGKHPTRWVSVGCGIGPGVFLPSCMLHEGGHAGAVLRRCHAVIGMK